MSNMVDGNPNAPLMIIGMAPGREELLADKPFIGGSGRLLWGQLERKAGIVRPDCYIVNVIGEWPEGTNGEPTKAQINKYWDAFDEAVSKSRARYILTLGGTAFRRMTGIDGGIEDWRGYIVRPDECELLERIAERQGVYKASNSKRGVKKGDPKVEKVKLSVKPIWPEAAVYLFPTIHPSAVMRSGYGLLPAFSADIMRVGRAARGELALENPVWTNGLPRSRAVVYGEPVVFDIETGGIENSTITRIGATRGDEVWTAPWDNAAREALREDISLGGPMIAFNIGFDAPRLAAQGCAIPEPWWDVMLAAAMAQPDLKKSLNYVASMWLDKHRHKHLSEQNPAFYNAMDVGDTKGLYYILRGDLERTGQLALFEQRMMPAVPVLVEMTQRGIMVDIERKNKWIDELIGQQTQLMDTWQGLAPGQKTSGSKLSEFLYGELGLPTQYHKHGGITSEVSGLRKLLLEGQLNSRQHAVITTLLELRGIQKELSTYAKVESGNDGCIHPGFLPAGKDTDSYGKGIAGTGRITSSNPNIQNQPGSARRMYIPRRGMVFLEADFSQIEARILAQLSCDEVLKAAIAEGLHETNMKILNVDKTRAKNGFYGWAYGAGKRTLANTFAGHGYRISEEECGRLLAGFDRRFTAAARFRRQISAELTSRYYLTNAFGRRRYFMGGSRDIPKGLDFHPQSCAADIMWGILKPIKYGLREIDGCLLATIHDSVLCEVPIGQEAEGAVILRSIMEAPIRELSGLVVPIEIKKGMSWGEMEKMA